LHTNRSVCFQMNDTKEYIIDQAYKLFLSHSYEAVTISDISKAIGLTKGALYHHFINKEELFRAVIDKHLIIDLMDNDVKYDSLLQYIEVSIEASRKVVFNTFGSNNDFIPINYVSLLIDALRHYPNFTLNKEGLFNSQIEKIKEVLFDAVKKHEIRDDLDIDITAVNFLSINLGLASNLFTNKSPSLAIEILKRQLYEFYKILKD
jgi:TetR/AcrR family transcriptional regulator, transcriptional repressor for nem operon